MQANRKTTPGLQVPICKEVSFQTQQGLAVCRAGSGSKPAPNRVNSKRCSESIKLCLILENSSHVSWISARNPSTPGIIASGNNSLRLPRRHLPIIPIQPQIPPLRREATRARVESEIVRPGGPQRRLSMALRQAPEVPLTQPHYS